MNDVDKTRDQLISEINDLRRKFTELQDFKLEQERSKNALAVNKNRYKSLVELSPEAIFVHQEGVILYINPGAAKIFAAAEPNELLHKPLLTFFHPDYHDIVKLRLREIYEKEKTLNSAELKCIRLDDAVIDVEANGTHINYSGRPAGLSIIRDVTKRKRAEAALKQSERHHHKSRGGPAVI